MKRPTTTAFALGALLTLAGACATAGDSHRRGSTYDVTITNLTHGVSFTPFLVASHSAAPDLLFTPGGAPSDELAVLAESGNVAPLANVLSSDPRLMDIDEGTSGLLGPGESVTVTIQAIPGWGHVSLVAMLLPTNDGMIALQNMRVPVGKQPSTALAFGYDAGSEPNDELCASIPGPPGTCGGQGGSAPSDDDEGYVHIHPGIHGSPDLDPAEYDWRNPVARVTIMRTY